MGWKVNLFFVALTALATTLSALYFVPALAEAREWLRMEGTALLWPVPTFFFYVKEQYPHQRVIATTRTDPPFQIVMPDPVLDRVIPYFIIKTGVWEPHLTSIFQRYLNGSCTKDTLVVDGGANNGYFGLYAAAMGCRVIAIEPQVRLTRLIEQSVKLNEWTGRVKIIQAAISNEAGETHVGLGDQRWGGARVVEYESVPEKLPDFIVPVPAVTLDDVVPTGEIFLMKLDCEGFELRIMLGAMNLMIERRVRYAIMEIYHREPESWLPFLEKLDELGYSVSNSQTPEVHIPKASFGKFVKDVAAQYAASGPMVEIFIARQPKAHGN